MRQTNISWEPRNVQRNVYKMGCLGLRRRVAKPCRNKPFILFTMSLIGYVAMIMVRMLGYNLDITSIEHKNQIPTKHINSPRNIDRAIDTGHNRKIQADQHELHRSGNYAEMPKAIRIKKEIDVPHLPIDVGKNVITLKPMRKNRNSTFVAENVKDPVKTCNFTEITMYDTELDVRSGHCTFPEVTTENFFDQKINNFEGISLPLLSNYKNPCWYEALPKDYRYRSKVHMFWQQVKHSFDKMWPVLQKRRKRKHFWRLRCLPLVYVIGLAKSGITDLHYSLLQHPHVTPAATREPFYWSRDRWKWNSPISDYLDLFDEAAERIRKHTTNSTRYGTPADYHPVVTIDGSVNYLYEFGGLNQIKGNYEDSAEPKYFTPHLIRHLTPNTDIKVVVTIRNPTERLFGVYCLHKEYGNIFPNKFHNIVLNQIKRFNTCLKSYSLKSCAHNKDVVKSIDKVELFSGIYHVFLEEWLGVFPHMKIIHWEDYKLTKSKILMDIFDYIGLSRDVMEINITNAVIDEDSSDDIKMLHKTEKLLNDFYEPYNMKLAELLKRWQICFIYKLAWRKVSNNPSLDCKAILLLFMVLIYM